MLGKRQAFLSLRCSLFLVLMAAAVSSLEVRRKRSDDGGPLEAVVQHLSQQVTSLNAQLTQVDSRTAALERKASSLDQTVAFYAWNSVNPLSTAALGTLIFDHTATNIGNAYDTLTGVFTAPSSGLYYFQSVFVSYNPGASGATHAAIYVESQMMAIGISDARHGYYDQTTINVILYIQAGQRVYVKNTDNAPNNYYDYISSPHTTFSGFLIKAD